eukprot:TRINITY_DN26129_c0_g2_i1.p1 TRINITY_DN26129_c0_g2~~TRINITY_DN26129_c0_g2_i1.p1  ORF type:complete len:386 (-),score=56.35 TRINITY_DN26129_c0_g2_i1:27-1106(-)
MAVGSSGSCPSEQAAVAELAIEEDAAILDALRGNRGTVARELRAQPLCAALQRARSRLDGAHRSATEVWQSPLSLFSAAAEARASRRGVPLWAVFIVRDAKALAEEAVRLRDLGETYEAQILTALRDGREVHREHLLQLFERLSNLTSRMYTHMPRLKAARAAFDAPEQAPQQEPGDLPESRAAPVTTVADEAEVILKPLSQAPNSFLSSISAAGTFDGMWRLLQTSQGRGAYSQASSSQMAPDQPIQRPEEDATASRPASDAAAVRKQRLKGWASPVFEAASAALGLKTHVHRVESPETVCRQPWHDVRGSVSSWLVVEDVARQRQHIRARLELPMGAGSHSRWKRCRRGPERRWTLA